MPTETLIAHGAVSKETAEAMAIGARRHEDVDQALEIKTQYRAPGE